MESFKLNLGGKEYILPPPYLRFMPKIAPQVDVILSLQKTDRTTVSYIAAGCDAAMAIVTTLLLPSFPALTEAQLREVLEDSFSWDERTDFLIQVLDYLRAAKIIAPVKATPEGEADAPA